MALWASVTYIVQERECTAVRLPPVGIIDAADVAFVVQPAAATTVS